MNNQTHEQVKKILGNTKASFTWIVSVNEQNDSITLSKIVSDKVEHYETISRDKANLFMPAMLHGMGIPVNTVEI